MKFKVANITNSNKIGVVDRHFAYGTVPTGIHTIKDLCRQVKGKNEILLCIEFAANGNRCLE